MQRNKNSKYQPDKPAFAGKTPFAKRMRRALGEDSPVQTSTKNEKTTSKSRSSINIIAIVIFIAVLLSYNYTDEFNTQSSVESELGTKNVVLCGASSGIGEEIAYYLSKHKVRNLILSARREEKLKRVAETCIRLGAQNVHIVPADFSELDSADKFASRVREILNDEVDFLILNHAWINARDWVEHLDDGNAHNYVRQMMETNFISFVNVVSSLLKYMESTSGRVLVSSSGAGKGPVHKMAAYSASKHAIHGFFGSLRQDLMWHKSNVTITEAVIGRISTENANNALSGQYVVLELCSRCVRDVFERVHSRVACSRITRM